MSKLPGLFGRYFRHGQFRLAKQGNGYAMFELRDHPRPTLTQAVLIVGWLQGILSRCGARAIDVRLGKVASLGDRCDRFESTWS